jgi:AcrR family transcriptional regulator
MAPSGGVRLTTSLNNYIVSVQMSTSTPVRERGPDTATRILEAAEVCIRRYGLRRVSMGDVAQAAGLSRGSVYNHFHDREALIDAVLERAADRFVASSEASVKRRRTLASQVAEAAAFICTHGNDPLLTLDPDDEPLLALLLTARVDGLVARWVEFWLPYLDDAERRREVRVGLDRSRAAEWIVRLLLSLVVMPSTVVDLHDPDAVRSYVQEFVVRGLAP